MAVITVQDMEDAKEDADDFETIVNGSATVNGGTGIVTTRLGTAVKTAAKIAQDLSLLDIGSSAAAIINQRISDLMLEANPAERTGTFTGNADASNYYVNGDQLADSPTLAKAVVVRSTQAGNIKIIYARKNGSNGEILKEETQACVAGTNVFLLDFTGVDLTGGQVYIGAKSTNPSLGIYRYRSGAGSGQTQTWYFASNGSAFTGGSNFSFDMWLLRAKQLSAGADVKGATGLLANTIDLNTETAARKLLQLPAGDITISSLVTLPGNTLVRGVKGSTRLLIGSLAEGIRINSANTCLQDVEIVGSGSAITTSSGISSDADIEALTGLGTKIGINIVAGSAQGITLDNVKVTNINGIGIQVSGTSAAPYGGWGSMHNCQVRDCDIGYNFAATGEYGSMTSLHANKNIIGCRVLAGNTNFANCNWSGNRINVVLGDSSNDSHGTMVGCLNNHADVWGIYAYDCSFGYSIIAGQHWFAGIRLTDSNGIIFVGSIIRSNFETKDCPMSLVANCGFGAAATFTETGSGVVPLRKNNYRIDGTAPGTLNDPVIANPPAAVTLQTNGQFAIEMTSNTAGNLVFRGSDGTTRRFAFTVS